MRWIKMRYHLWYARQYHLRQEAIFNRNNLTDDDIAALRKYPTLIHLQSKFDYHIDKVNELKRDKR